MVIAIASQHCKNYDFLMKFKIPKKVMLMSREINVVYDKNLRIKNGFIGESNYTTGKITLQDRQLNDNFNKKEVEITYLHELIHYIFYSLNEHELNKNEQLVDNLAQLLHQAITKSEY